MRAINYIDDPFQKGKIFGLNLDSMKESHYSESSIYSFKAYWLKNIVESEKYATLCQGKVELSFDSRYAQELDQRPHYRNMSIEEVFSLARPLVKKKSDRGFTVNAKKISSYAIMQFGRGSIWVSDQNMNEYDFRDHVNAWFDLPNLPEGFEWIKFSN